MVTRNHSASKRGQKLVRAEGLEPSLSLRKNGFSYPPTAFAAPAVLPGFGVWTIPSPSRLFRSSGAARLVSTPSSTEISLDQGLARDRHFTGFPEFEQFYTAGFPASTQVFA